jgi:Family of unknown function (DUF6084)
MPEVAFAITGVTPVTRGLTPLVHFNLQITPPPGTEAIQALILHAQVQVQAPRRAYSASEKERLVDLFGPPENWGQTLRNRLYACKRRHGVATWEQVLERLLPEAEEAPA